MPRIADFDRFVFVVGAPRCGTTTISRLLDAHPEIASPAVKEPHFFSQHDLRGLADDELRAMAERDYLGRFFDPPSGRQHVGADGSVSYLYVPEQLDPILRLWPEARFIVSLRDPMAMLPSLHERLIYIGDETITRFEDAWAATADRAAGRRIPRSCVDPRWLRYDEAGRLGTYVERLFATVGRERCHVALFDDWTADPQRAFSEMLAFLELAPMEVGEVEAERSSRTVRWHWLQRLLKRPPERLRAYTAGKQYRRRVQKEPAHMNGQGGALEAVMAVRKRLLRWNRIEAPQREISLGVQQQIRKSLKSEVDLLGELIGRDLGAWLQPRIGSNRLESP